MALRDSQTFGLLRDFADAKLGYFTCVQKTHNLSQRLRDSSGGVAVAERSKAK